MIAAWASEVSDGEHREGPVAGLPPILLAGPRDHDAAEQAADLVRLGRVAGGDQDAFGELYDRHSAAVLGLLVRLLGDRTEAEEVLQETFLQAWRQALRFRAELATVRGWLLMVARSRALDRRRANRSRLVREDVVAAETPQSIDDVESQALSGSTRSQVRRALASLPSEQRQALELAFFAGLTHVEVAARLGQPLGTVKSRILLGMQKLRKLLAP